MKLVAARFVTTLMTLLLTGASSARAPTGAEVPLTPRTRDRIARSLIDQSVVIAEGNIVWSKQGWAAVSSRNSSVLDALPVLQVLPKLKPSKVLKGPFQSLYPLISQPDGTPRLQRLPPGTFVRLLLVPLKTRQGNTIWEVSDTSYSGRREDERSIDAAIDKLLGSKRRAAPSLQYETVPLR